jgi:radical SAM superfamily enzyme YgiQ (UPF0313 family)
MKVLLVNPKGSRKIPLSLCSIYSYLRVRGHNDLKLCDLTYNGVSKIVDNPSSIYIINWESESQLESIIEALKLLDKSSCYTVAIGKYCIDNVEECLKYVDMCVMGDPEIPVTMLVESRRPEEIPGMALYSKNEIMGTTGHHGGKRLVLVEKLDELPFPNRSILNHNWNTSPMELVTSRKGLDGVARVRSVEDVMKEVQVLHKKFKVNEFILRESICEIRDEKFKEEFSKLGLGYTYFDGNT